MKTDSNRSPVRRKRAHKGAQNARQTLPYAQEVQYRQLLEQVPAAVVLYALEEGEHPILYANHIARSLFHTYVGEGDPVGVSALMFIPDNEREMVAKIIAQLGVGINQSVVEEHLISPDGQAIDILASSTVTMFEGQSAVLLVFSDISELKRTQAVLVRREQLLSAMQERERLARELHDGLGQMMGYLNVQAQATQALIANGQLLAAQANLQQMAQAAQDTHSNLRNHILGLRVSNPAVGNLLQALDTILQQFTEVSGIPAILSMPPNIPAAIFAPAIEDQVLHILQEALVNVRKHANAHKVELVFSFTPTQVQMVLVDDGIGFDAMPFTPTSENRHFGLSIMRERAAQFGGWVEIRSVPGGGTQVFVIVPRQLSDNTTLMLDDLSVLQNIRVLLVDDHPLFLDGIRNLLTARGITVIGLAHDGFEAHSMARKLHPDVVVMDVEMPHCNGVEAARLIKCEMPEIKIVMLTMSDSEDNLFAALRNGASGYLLKSLDANEFCQLLADVMHGQVPLPPALAARVLTELSQKPAVSAARATDRALSPRQWEILNSVAQGKIYKEIAVQLNVSEKTVKYHMGQILDHLHLESREQAIAYAARFKQGA